MSTLTHGEISLDELKQLMQAERDRRDDALVATLSGNPSVDELDALLLRESSYSRLPVLLEIGAYIDRDVYITLLGNWWSSCDNISEHTDEIWNDIFDYGVADARPLMMDETEQQAFEQLPDVVTVYRGCYADNKWGMSWSLDKEVAERFPFLNRYRSSGRPLLVKARIQKQDIVALKLDRNESEVICMSKPRHVSTSNAIGRHVVGGAGK